LKTKTIEIGDWNMDATASVSIAHGLTYGNIRFAHASIRNDLDTMGTPLPGNLTTSVDLNLTWDGTNVILTRRSGVAYDSTDYDSTSFNRGWVILWYV